MRDVHAAAGGGMNKLHRGNWFNTMLVGFQLLSLFVGAAVAAPTMHPPNTAQRQIIAKLLGEEFMQGPKDGPFQAKVEVMVFDLNNDGTPDFIVTQRGWCS